MTDEQREERKPVPWGESQEFKVQKQAEERPLDDSKQICLERRGLPLNRKRKAVVSGGMMEWRAFADRSEIDLFLWLYVSLEA